MLLTHPCVGYGPPHDYFEVDDTIRTGSFKLSDNQDMLSEYPFSRNVGPVTDAEAAVAVSKGLWIEVYGSEEYFYFQWPTKAYYDPASECWFVSGTLPDDWVGGVPHVLIEADGDVLAVWHDM